MRNELICAIKEIKELENATKINAEIKNCISSITKCDIPKPAKNALETYSENYRMLAVHNYCSVIVRLYSIYEHFCEQIIEKYIAILSGNVDSFSNHACDIKNKYFALFKDYINDKRICNCHEDAIEALRHINQSLLDDNPLLYGKFFSRHTANLRSETFSLLANQAGIDGIRGVINKTFRGRDTKLCFYIDDLVQRRNDIAHGTLDINEIMSDNMQLELLKSVGVTTTLVRRHFKNKLLQILSQKSSKLSCVKKFSSSIGLFSPSDVIYRNDFFLCEYEDGSFHPLYLEDMRKDDQPIQLSEAGMEITIKFTGRYRTCHNIYAIRREVSRTI